jgi:hypothetical protein
LPRRRTTVKTFFTEFVRFLASPDFSLMGRILIWSLVGAVVGGMISLGRRLDTTYTIKAVIGWGAGGWFLGLFIQYAISEMRSFD